MKDKVVIVDESFTVFVIDRNDIHVPKKGCMVSQIGNDNLEEVFEQLRYLFKDIVLISTEEEKDEQ